MKLLGLLAVLVLAVACASTESKNEVSENIKSQGMGVSIETSDINFDPEVNVANFEVFGQCLPKKEAVFVKYKGNRRTVPCVKNKGYRYRIDLDSGDLNKIRKAGKDHHVFVQAYHYAREGGKAKLHMFIGSKDYQVKLIVINSLRFVKDTEKPITMLDVYGSCRQGANVDIVIDDESKSLEVFRKTQACSDDGFSYVDQIVGEFRPDTFFQAIVSSDSGAIMHTKRFSIHGREAKARVPSAMQDFQMKVRTRKSAKKKK